LRHKDKGYPEVQALKEIYQKHEVKIKISDDDFLAGNKDYPAVVVNFGKTPFDLYADDEYSDFNLNNPLLNLCVILRELDYYADSIDYLLWCKELNFEPNNIQVLNYYRSLGGIYREIEKILGKIDPQITDWDFEMNAGPAFELREYGKI
jgi:hypothetical protein